MSLPTGQKMLAVRMLGSVGRDRSLELVFANFRIVINRDERHALELTVSED